MSVIDDVRARLDIVEVIGTTVPLQRAGRSFRALCPFHTERTPSFFVFPDRQSWRCFGACSTGGDLFSFVMRQQGLPFGEALRLLAAQAGVPLPEQASDGQASQERDRLQGALEAAALFYYHRLLTHPAAEAARRHLLGRGLQRETWERFLLGQSPEEWESLSQHLRRQGYRDEELEAAGLALRGASGSLHDRFRGRLMIPIRDLQGRTVGFGARALDESAPKYLNSPQTDLFEKSSLLFGLDRAREEIRHRGSAVLVEGYMDVLMAHQQGAANVVATMGTSLTESQVRLLKRYTKSIVLALDADAAGSIAALRGVEVASRALEQKEVPVLTWRGLVRYRAALDGEVRILSLPSGLDPDELLREDPARWQQLVDSAQPMLDYLMESAVRNADLSRPQEKASVTDSLLGVIITIESPVQGAYYLQRLARLVGVREELLIRRVRDLQRGRGQRATEGQTTQERFLVPEARVGEHCLALLLQEPALRPLAIEVRPEYFSFPEQRALFEAWQEAGPGAMEIAHLDPLLRPLAEDLSKRPLPPMNTESRRRELVSSGRRLEEHWLREQDRILADLLNEEEKAHRQGWGDDRSHWQELHQQAMAVGARLQELWRRQPEVLLSDQAAEVYRRDDLDGNG